MRRKDKEITNINDILNILNDCDIARLGLCDRDKPYVIPLNFGFEYSDNNIIIYFHCAAEGRKIDIIKQNNNACFEIDVLDNLVGGTNACDWAAKYRSIIGEGKIEIVTKKAEKIKGLTVLMQKYVDKSPEFNEKAVEAVCVLKLELQNFAAKANK